MTVMYIDVANVPNRTLMTTQMIGNVAPLHCTGVGKLFLTQYSPVELERLVSLKKLQGFTRRTITDAETLKTELENVRKTGYAFDNQECEEGARCVAAPIRGHTGRIIACISVSGPAVRMTNEHIFANLHFLLEAAGQISARLGWKGEK